MVVAQQRAYNGSKIWEVGANLGIKWLFLLFYKSSLFSPIEQSHIILMSDYVLKHATLTPACNGNHIGGKYGNAHNRRKNSSFLPKSAPNFVFSQLANEATPIQCISNRNICRISPRAIMGMIFWISSKNNKNPSQSCPIW